jgi:hypothetical protein
MIMCIRPFPIACSWRRQMPIRTPMILNCGSRKPNETVRSARSEQPSTLQCLRTMCSPYSPILIGAPHEQSIRVWKMSRPT